jgi:hypothetical protein
MLLDPHYSDTWGSASIREEQAPIQCPPELAPQPLGAMKKRVVLPKPIETQSFVYAFVFPSLLGAASEVGRVINTPGILILGDLRIEAQWARDTTIHNVPFMV